MEKGQGEVHQVYKGLWTRIFKKKTLKYALWVVDIRVSSAYKVRMTCKLWIIFSFFSAFKFVFSQIIVAALETRKENW